MAQTLWKTKWWFLRKLNIELPCDPAIPLLVMCPKELEAGAQTSSSTSLFIAALFANSQKVETTQSP